MTGHMPPASKAMDKNTEHHDVIVVGAGFAGVYAVYRFKKQGLDVVCLEAAGDVGGVWYHNRYPGARCDVISIDYSYSFSDDLQNEWNWSERYSSQPEILRYIQHVAERFKLRSSMVFNARVADMKRNDKTGLWTLETANRKKYTAKFVVLATGPISEPQTPEFPGLNEFKGEIYQTSRWPHHPVSFEGKRVAVIGTGSSGVQAIAEIAKTAGHLDVFQRTPPFVTPAHNAPLPDAELAELRSRYSEYRRELRDSFSANYLASTGKTAAQFDKAEQRKVLDQVWAEGGHSIISIFTDILFDQSANDIVANYVRERIREMVRDKATAEKLTPKTYPIGTKRPCISDEYYPAFNRSNVSLVDVNDTPIQKFTPTGIQTTDKHYDLDTVVIAIGFDALTGAATAIDPVNGSGQRLTDVWKDGAPTYLGLAVAGFPNLFMVSGPGSTSVFGNVVTLSEEGVDWIADCIAWLDKHGYETIEATSEAQAGWTKHVADVAQHTLFLKAESWYVGANIEGKTRGILAYLGGFNTYVGKCKEVAQKGYEGFVAR